MWDCTACGCRAIAPGVPFCPQCYATKEEGMARITVEGGSSDRFEPGDEEPAVAPVPVDEPPVAPQEPEQAQEDPKPGQDVLSELEAAAAALKRPAKQDG